MPDFTTLSSCTLCPKLGTDHVPPWGKLYKPAIFIVGQSPGAKELKEGKPFVGPSGQLLDGLLTELGLARDECYITNVVKCKPPGNRASTPEEKANCTNTWLRHEISELNPKVMLLLGRDAHEALLPQRFQFSHYSVIRTGLRTYISAYHPAYWLRRQTLKEFLELAGPIRDELAHWLKNARERPAAAPGSQIAANATPESS